MSKSAKLLQERLQPLRERHGAIAEFCRKTGFARGTVENWIDGTSAPGLENIDRIADAFGVTASELINPETPDPSKATLEECLSGILAALGISIPVGVLSRSVRERKVGEDLSWLRVDLLEALRSVETADDRAKLETMIQEALKTIGDHFPSLDEGQQIGQSVQKVHKNDRPGKIRK